MTPFDTNPDNDAGHAIDQDDLIAFHLHELPSPQERAVRRVLHTNPALQSESLAIASTLRAFPKHEPSLPLDHAALDRHWQTLHPALTAYVPLPATAFSRFRLQVQHWALPTVAAVAATALIIAFQRNRPEHSIHLAASHPYIAPSSPTTVPPSPTTFSNAMTLPSSPYRTIFNPPSQQPSTPQPTPITSTPNPKPATAPTVSTPSPSTSSITASSSTTESPNPAGTTATLPSPAEPSAPPHSSHAHYEHTTDVTLAVIGNLTPHRSFTSNSETGAVASYTQEATPSVGALAAFHQQLRPLLGYRVTVDYSEPTYQYVYTSPGSSGEGNIVYQHVYELSGTYVVQGPHHRRISTSVEAGAGLLAFLPANTEQTTLPVGNSLRAAGVIGGSAELTLSKHIAIHAGYRGLFYKSPTIYPTYGATIPPPPNNLTFSNEPLIGLTYRFRPTREE